MEKIITAEETLRLLTRAVEEKGEGHVYPTFPGTTTTLSCYYAKDGKPSCIVGHVLFDLGVPISDMTHDDENGRYGRISLGVIGGHRASLRSHYGLTFDNAAWSMLCVAQEVQDCREPWGEALAAAALYLPKD